MIAMQATGGPIEFAKKLGIKRSTLYDSLQEMKVLGVDIRYSSARQSYYYADERRIKINFEITGPSSPKHQIIHS
jgi:biotin operon repressor